MCQEDKYPEMMLLAHIMKRTHKRIEELLDDRDVKQGQLGILFTLQCNPGLSQRELAEKLSVTPPSITVAIRKMEQAGLIGRRPDDVDQRVMRLEIREKGKEILGEAMECVDILEKRMFQGFSQEERMLFRRLLMQINDNVK